MGGRAWLARPWGFAGLCFRGSTDQRLPGLRHSLNLPPLLPQPHTSSIHPAIPAPTHHLGTHPPHTRPPCTLLTPLHTPVHLFAGQRHHPLRRPLQPRLPRQVPGAAGGPRGAARGRGLALPRLRPQGARVLLTARCGCVAAISSVLKSSACVHPLQYKSFSPP